MTSLRMHAGTGWGVIGAYGVDRKDLWVWIKQFMFLFQLILVRIKILV